MVSHWAGTNLALPGGKAKNNINETALETVNREFLEETGCDISFQETDYCFSVVDQHKVNHVFGKVTNDLKEFERVLSCFHTDSTRNAYVDEIFGTVSFPLWIEGPTNARTATLWGQTQVLGLPRFLNDFAFRDYKMLLVLLVKTRVLSIALLKRVLVLSSSLSSNIRSPWSFERKIIHWLNSSLNPNNDKLFDYDTFIAIPGLKQIFLDCGVVCEV